MIARSPLLFPLASVHAARNVQRSMACFRRDLHPASSGPDHRVDNSRENFRTSLIYANTHNLECSAGLVELSYGSRSGGEIKLNYGSAAGRWRIPPGVVQVTTVTNVVLYSKGRGCSQIDDHAVTRAMERCATTTPGS